MPSSKSLERLLDRLEVAKRQFGSKDAATVEILTALGRRRFPDARSLVDRLLL